jgi:hypothetical protein
MDDQAKLLTDLTALLSSMNAKLDDIHPAVLDLHTWKPSIERSVESLRAEVGDLRAHVIEIARPPPATSPHDELPSSPSTHGGRALDSSQASGQPQGHVGTGSRWWRPRANRPPRHIELTGRPLR